MDVFLLWHVRHAEFVDGSPTEHFDSDGELIIEEDQGDDVKVLGIFTTPELAKSRIELAQTEPGFRDEPECFYISPYTLDEPQWVDGFFSERINDEAD